VDQAELDHQGLALAVESTDQLNAAQTQTSFELEIGQPKAGIAAANVSHGSARGGSETSATGRYPGIHPFAFVKR
jgi:hypothetical protein